MCDTLNYLTKYCQEHKYVDNTYIYSSCSDMSDNDYLLVIQKLQDAKTNEDRNDIVNASTATFWTNTFKIVAIISENGMSEIDRIIGVFNHNNERMILLMEKGETIRSGITYFKTIETAYYQKEYVPDLYTGTWICWNENGQKNFRGEYVNGEKSGKWTYWYDNGNKFASMYYVKDKKYGKWIYWHNNGNKYIVVHYGKNGFKAGKCLYWYDNGNIRIFGRYKNDIPVGVWTLCNERGEVTRKKKMDKVCTI